MKKSGVIEINGRRYSAHDGRQLDNASAHHAAPSGHSEKPKPIPHGRQKAAFVKRRPQNRSELLMRQAVRPPAPYVRVTYRANGALEPDILIESNVPIEQRIARRVDHARKVHKSHNIKHFDSFAQSHYVNNRAVPLPAPQPLISDFKVNEIHAPRPAKQPRTSADILELAMKNANLYEPVEAPRKTSFLRLRRRPKHYAQ